MVSKRQLKIFIDTEKDIPYKVIQIIVAAINYGGRVTDDKDIRLINTILKKYINEKLFEEGYKFSTSGEYYAPPPGDRDSYLNYIK